MIIGIYLLIFKQYLSGYRLYMKKINLLIVLFAPAMLYAQKNVEGLIRSEKNFSAYAVAHNTKDAFLKFADSNAVVFDKGEAVNAIQLWSAKENRGGILEWHPQFAEVSNSGDFGYTTGPWTFRMKATDSIVGRGQFTSVWHIDKNGDWKFLVDLGNGNSPVNPAMDADRIETSKTKGQIEEVLQAEYDFISLFTKNPSLAYARYLSGQTILNRNSRLPSTGMGVQQTISETPVALQLEAKGSGMASSNDLAFVYGACTLENKRDNYLHIWRKEKGGWKIALEVLRY